MEDPRRIVTAVELEKMTPQERADAVGASIVRSLEDLSEEFRVEIQATAARLGEQRRSRA